MEQRLSLSTFSNENESAGTEWTAQTAERLDAKPVEQVNRFSGPAANAAGGVAPVVLINHRGVFPTPSKPR